MDSTFTSFTMTSNLDDLGVPKKHEGNHHPWHHTTSPRHVSSAPVWLLRGWRFFLTRKNSSWRQKGLAYPNLMLGSASPSGWSGFCIFSYPISKLIPTCQHRPLQLQRNQAWIWIRTQQESFQFMTGNKSKVGSATSRRLTTKSRSTQSSLSDPNGVDGGTCPSPQGSQPPWMPLALSPLLQDNC